MYNSIAQLLAIADSNGQALWEAVLENEMHLSGLDASGVWEQLREHLSVMRLSAARALERGQGASGSLIEGVASRQYALAESDGGLSGKFMNRVMARALSCSETNAAMGRICAAPTAGACGIIPAVIISVEEKLGLPERRTLEAMLTASGIGTVIVQNATISGAEAGCQAECGVAAAMAAAAAVQMSGGNNAVCVHAFSFALINAMGLICDPVAGLVQVPCAQRNASQAVNALLCADMALSGSECIIPADEVVEAMYNVGRMLPVQLKETAQGGIAATPTALAIARRLFS